jgi:hypothetical protein
MNCVTINISDTNNKLINGFHNKQPTDESVTENNVIKTLCLELYEIQPTGSKMILWEDGTEGNDLSRL